MPTSSDLPIAFYLSCVAILLVALYAWLHRRQGWGLPAMTVMGTVSVWYVADVIYNDYRQYVATIGTEALDAAWWQVVIFVVSFGILAPLLHRWMNNSISHRGSMMMRYFETNRLQHPDVQNRISRAANGLFIAWAILMLIALVRVKGNFVGLFFPYLGEKAEPWGRNRIGGGLDALISLASYVQVFLTAGAGVIAAIARRPSTRSIAIAICFLTFPTYIFDRTRNVMLATVLPGLLAWVFFRLRGGIFVKIAVLGMSFMAVNAWFSFVMANRSDVSIAAAVASEGNRMDRKGKHEGLNMFEELGWVNALIKNGRYSPNFGARYFAELVNPIPRIIWKNKPEIGIDYAIARGQGGNDAASGGVFATLSTGMIGQGVVNFGTIFGPMAAAALIAAWAALLARQDLLGADPARLLLYACGLTLTFNIGRDITLLVLYPFLFGLGMLKVWYYFHPPTEPSAPPPRPRKPRPKAPERGLPAWRDDVATENHDSAERLPYERL